MAVKTERDGKTPVTLPEANIRMLAVVVLLSED